MMKFEKQQLAKELGQEAQSIINVIQRAGGRPVLVGGRVRDILRQGTVPDGDIDIEVFGIQQQELEHILKAVGPIETVGKQFAVYKIGTIDISLPRRDSKVQPGHKGFQVKGDPGMTFKEAARRRDFTINAMGIDLQTLELLDPYHGQKDLIAKTVRAVDPTTFIEDPLRALRAMQFAARFEMTVEKKTAEICKEMPINELTPARTGEEWKRLLLQAEKPSRGLVIGVELMIIQRLYPELDMLRGVPQNPLFHPEGDVWNHMLQCLDFAATTTKKLKLNKEERLTMMLAALCHDLGKPETTRKKDGRWVSYGHEQAGITPATTFLKAINTNSRTIQKVQRLIENHMVLVNQHSITNKMMLHLADRLMPASIEELAILIDADQCGRGPVCKEDMNTKELRRRAKELGVEHHAPTPIIQGKDLIKKGYQEGEKLGEALRFLYAQQLDGKLTTKDEGIKLLK